MKRRVHLVGIGGSGLSAIARVLHERGELVTGSDQAPNERTRALEQDGVTVYLGHRAEHVAGADLVLMSSAVSEDNPEVEAARTAGLPVYRRTDFLGELTAGIRTVAVAGTHGKTTTTALIAWILRQAGRDPGFVLGGHSTDLGGNGGAGAGDVFVIEADEYDRAFLGLHPSLGVVTNVEYDHPDLFPSPADYAAAFQRFVERVEDRLIVCREDPVAAGLSRPGIERHTYAIGGEADWTAEEIRPNPAGGSDFLAFFRGTSLGLIRTRIPGRHNVLNTLAALAAVDAFAVPLNESRQALTGFNGVERRFSLLGEAAGVAVIDDYAHHPTEIRATLAAARQRFPGREVWAVFQPHTYTRTAALAGGFAAAFNDADHVVVTGVFGARESRVEGIDAAWLVGAMAHPDAVAQEDLDRAADTVVRRLKPPAAVVILSAGDGDRAGRRILKALQAGGKGAGDER